MKLQTIEGLLLIWFAVNTVVLVINYDDSDVKIKLALTNALLLALATAITGIGLIATSFQ